MDARVWMRACMDASVGCILAETLWVLSGVAVLTLTLTLTTLTLTLTNTLGVARLTLTLWVLSG